MFISPLCWYVSAYNSEWTHLTGFTQRNTNFCQHRLTWFLPSVMCPPSSSTNVIFQTVFEACLCYLSCRKRWLIVFTTKYARRSHLHIHIAASDTETGFHQGYNWPCPGASFRKTFLDLDFNVALRSFLTMCLHSIHKMSFWIPLVSYTPLIYKSQINLNRQGLTKILVVHLDGRFAGSSSDQPVLWVHVVILFV